MRLQRFQVFCWMYFKFCLLLILCLNQVTPAAGIIRPNHIAEVSVHHNEFQTKEFVDGVPQDCWCEHNRDTEIILVVKVRGSYTTEARNHRVCVRSLPHG